MVDVDDDVDSDCTKAHVDATIANYGIVNVSSVEEKQKTCQEDRK